MAYFGYRIYTKQYSITDSLFTAQRLELTNGSVLYSGCGAIIKGDPSLDELSFLSGVTAVDDAVGSLHQFLDGSKLWEELVVG